MMGEAPYPWIEFSVTVGTWDLVELAYPDTGFEGGLLIPAGVGREVLASPNLTPLRLADGAILEVRSWRGTLEIADHRFLIEVAAMGTRYR